MVARPLKSRFIGAILCSALLYSVAHAQSDTGTRIEVRHLDPPLVYDASSSSTPTVHPASAAESIIARQKYEEAYEAQNRAAVQKYDQQKADEANQDFINGPYLIPLILACVMIVVILKAVAKRQNGGRWR